jgi:chromosome segregation ATPase
MEKNYIDHYIEILTSTMNDAVVRNISLQANAKITDVAIGQLNEKIIELENEINKYDNNTSSVEESYKNKINDYEKIITELNNNHSSRIHELNTEISNLQVFKFDYNNIKNQVSHIDTFRNELIKERELHQRTQSQHENVIKDLSNNYESKIKELNDKIDYLQLTPAKRKKIDELKQPSVELPNSSLDVIIGDGGSF